jgi:hypothetical protein
MKFGIRPYQHSDFETICSWWEASHETAPIPGMMIEYGTFILEIDGAPSMSLTVLLTQSKEISFLEGFIAKPGIEKNLRQEASQCLVNHCYSFAHFKGYKNILCYSKVEKLSKRYESLGMTRSQSGLTGFYRRF